MHTIASQGGATIAHDGKYVYKYGTRVNRSEFEVMKLIAKKTTVPVPAVYDYEEQGGQGCIKMAFVRGQPLSNTWATMSDESQQAIITTLKGYIAQWRAIGRPDTYPMYCNVLGEALSPEVPIPGRNYVGPYANDLTFRQTIGHAYQAAHGHRRTPQQVTDSLPASTPVLTHSDLVPRNVMVDGETITAIIDWEFAAYYPAYWEYTSAWWGDYVGGGVWDIDSLLDAHTDALNAINFVRHVLI